MTPQEYRDAIAELGLSIYAAGPVLGVSHRQSQRWAASYGSGPSETAAILLRLMLKTRHLSDSSEDLQPASHSAPP